MGSICFAKGFEYSEECIVHQAEQQGQLCKCISLTPVFLPSLTKPDLAP